MALPKFGSAKPATPTAAPAQPAPTPATNQPAATGRRRAAATSAPTVDHSTTGVRGEAPKKFIDGEYPCYVSATSHGDGGLGFKLRVHLPGDEFHGAEVGFYCSGKSQSAVAIKRKRREVAEFFRDSGFPETTWSQDATGNGRVPPVERFFVEPVEVDGKVYVVPVMLIGKFVTEANESNPSQVYQKVLWARRMEPLIVAPLPKYNASFMQALGWPGEVVQGNYGPQFVVDLDAAAATFECWTKAEQGQPVYPEDGGDGIPF